MKRMNTLLLLSGLLLSGLSLYGMEREYRFGDEMTFQQVGEVMGLVDDNVDVINEVMGMNDREDDESDGEESDGEPTHCFDEISEKQGGEEDQEQFRFRCLHCGEGFGYQCRLKDHEAKHTGEKPCVCDMCGQGFGNRNLLYQHKKKVHRNKHSQQGE